MNVTRRGELDAREGVDLGRRARRGAGSLIYGVTVLAALGAALWLAIEFRTSWDFTEHRANSLSERTIEALGSIDRPVHVYGLMKESDRKREGYWELLQLYRRRSDKVVAEVFDPNTRPGAFEKLGLSAEDRNTIKDGASVVVSGDRKVLFRGLTEEDVTNAILEVGSSESKVAGFIRGVGERDPRSTADAGMTRAREALEAEYYTVADVRLDAPIPPEVTILIAAGPRSPIPQQDLDRLGAWLERGGRLLFLFDPDYDSGLGEVVRRWGLRAKDIKVLDRRQNLRGQLEVPIVTDFSKHPIARGFSAAMPVVLPLPVPVEDFEPGDQEVFHQWLAKTGTVSEGLTPAGTREQGPFPVAAASWKALPKAVGQDAETRVVMVGNAAFASNAFLAESSNKSFFLNAVGWLSRSRGLVSIRKPPLEGQVLTMNRGDVNVYWAILLGPPALVIFVGVAVFLRRRRL